MSERKDYSKGLFEVDMTPAYEQMESTRKTKETPPAPVEIAPPAEIHQEVAKEG